MTADLPPKETPTSFASVYALEAQYQAIESEYKELIKRLKYTCVGRNRATAECRKAAQLNADMQTTLANLSTALKATGTPPKTPSIIAQQLKLLELADSLESEYVKLTAEREDAAVVTTMFKTHYLAWALGLGFLLALVWSRRRTI